MGGGAMPMPPGVCGGGRRLPWWTGWLFPLGGGGLGMRLGCQRRGREGYERGLVGGWEERGFGVLVQGVGVDGWLNARED